MKNKYICLFDLFAITLCEEMYILVLWLFECNETCSCCKRLKFSRLLREKQEAKLVCEL